MFGKKYPDVEVILLPARSSRQVEALKAGTLDIGCMRGTADEPTLVSRTAAREHLMIALPEKHSLASRRSVGMIHLQGERIVSYPRNQALALTRVMDEAWASIGGHQGEVLEADDWPSIVSLVAGGMGCALVPSSVSTLQMHGVVYRILRNCDLTSELCVVHRAGHRREHVQRLADALAQPCGQTSGRGSICA
jgi:DNA-binding transcriptional LysR family regulator